MSSVPSTKLTNAILQLALIFCYLGLSAACQSTHKPDSKVVEPGAPGSRPYFGR